MGLVKIAAVLLALGKPALSAPAPEALESSAAAKYCDASTGICYTEYTSPENIAFRIAIPDTATAGSFDILLQVVAPKAVGWAGIAWGGVMANNPLTVAWANPAGSSVVSSRKATSHTYPTAYPDATYTVLPGSTSNSTHWTLNALAKGVSSWGTTKLDPAATAVSLAYAQSAQAPSEPANNASRFSIHQTKAKFSVDLSSCKIANFTALVQKASSAKPATL
ncbi:cellobiose dehydrogenase [Diplogelasinospora grovesii]|uniref:Cellobiose dehydrogenase n=1 Tax=Diplogelasinospora grovesii TaxID=303347 RepID=A0AAN6RZR8_9PEZI|nr:cellobiose dehydrogenase [Diplogelasinospora grovesii]